MTENRVAMKDRLNQFSRKGLKPQKNIVLKLECVKPNWD